VLGLSFELADQLDVFSRDEVEEFAGLIAQQSLELEALIEDLLVAARADIERIKVARVRVDLPEVVEHAVAVTTAGWKSAIPIQVNNGDGPVVALGDELRIRQIVRNLLQNAHRYGGEDVQVVTSRNGRRCIVTVSDNGSGVVSHRIDSIFEPHVRAHNTSGSTDSLGLGLYVSRTLANLMDGSLEYRREGDRTHFDLILPAADETVYIRA
jgi:signal transduction histidine kinase